VALFFSVSLINAYDTPWIEKACWASVKSTSCFAMFAASFFPISFEPHAGKIADVLRSIDTALQTSLWLACAAAIGTISPSLASAAHWSICKFAPPNRGWPSR